METGIFLITMILFVGIPLFLIIGIGILKKLETRNELLKEQNKILKDQDMN